METVLAAIVIIFIIMFAALTFSQAILTTQDTITTTWMETSERLGEQSRTLVSVTHTYTASPGTNIELTIQNQGATRLMDFTTWDFVVTYTDDTASGDYHINWLTYTEDIPMANEWTIQGLYATEDVPEAHEPGILNPGEFLIVNLVISPALGPGETLHAALATGNGIGTSITLRRNIPPELVTNDGLTLSRHQEQALTGSLLETTDLDHDPSDLVYTVVALPEDGTLSHPDTFTQADIDAGDVMFIAGSSGAYTLEFLVTDGIDAIGPYEFDIFVINAQPVLIANHGLAVSSGDTQVITPEMLQVTDPDDEPENLLYTVTVPPTAGTLAPGITFTQAHIDTGLVSYTGNGDDSFTFSVSDGEHVLGIYTFQISAS